MSIANVIMSITNILSGIIMLIVGFVLRAGKSAWLIAGYNTMSKNERAMWNEKAMSSFIGYSLIISAVIFLAGGVVILFNIYPVVAMLISFFIVFLLIVFCVVYLNKSSRFKRTSQEDK